MRQSSKSHRLQFGTLLLACAAQPAFAGWQTLGTASQTTQTPGGVELATSAGALMQVTLVNADTVRVRVSPGGAHARDFSYAVPASVPAIEVRVENDPATGAITLRSSKGESLRVVITTKPAVSIAVFDARGNEIVADDPARPMAFDATGAIEVSKRRPPRELYYGFGEKALPSSRAQQYMTMWNTDAPKYAPGEDPLYQDIPFFVALRDGAAYGVFFDNTWRSWFDMGKTDPARYTFGAAGGELDYYVFGGGPGRTPARVLEDYTALTGRMPLPPLWALGYQQSRYSYTTAARVREVARGFRERKIPADVIYLDIDYMDGFRIFTWSPERFPDPVAMLGDLHALHFHPVTIVDPGVKVDRTFAIYRDGQARGVFVRDANGQELHAHVWPGNCAFPDFTDPAARAWFGSLYATFLDQGVSGFWNDMDEPATFAPDDRRWPILMHDPSKTFPLDARHAGDGQPGTHARYHNVYGMQMARATFDGLRRLRPDKRPFVLTRAGYAGVQRYSAVWTGDNVPSWEHLALSIPMLTGLSVSGVPFVGADIGGYGGSPSAELYARWLQAAVLTPFFRTHAETGSADREPWSFGPEFERINRATIELRYRLLPYLYTLFAASERDGAPVMRPLWFDYPHDYRTWLLDDEFLAGRDLLVAPVVHAAETARRVYFPQGDDWIDWWDGSRHAGGSWANVGAPLDRLPLFVRAGAAVPTLPVTQYTGAAADTPLTIVVATGADGGGSVYQDAGEGYGYRNGESRTIQIRLSGASLSFDMAKSRRFPGIEAVELLGLDAAPGDVRVDGKRADAQFDAATHRARIALPGPEVRRISFRRAGAGRR